jgi:hypothetical protein
MSNPCHDLIDEVCRENAVLLRLLGIDSLPANNQLSAVQASCPTPGQALDVYEALDKRNLALRAEVARTLPQIDLHRILDTALSQAA